MFDITLTEGGIIYLSGRFDASQTDRAREIFDRIDTTHTVDFSKLDYISSAGLGVLLKTQKRLGESNQELMLVKMNRHIFEIFNYAGFDFIFKIEKPDEK